MASSFLALLSFATVAAYPQTKLDIDFPGGRLEVLATEVAQQLGKQVTITPDVKNEIVVAYGQQVDSAQMIQHVAELTATTWTVTEDRITVSANAQVRQQELRQADAKHREYLRKGLENFKKQYEPTDYPPDEEGGEPYHYEPSAGEKLLVQVVTGLGENNLALVGSGQRVVFSSNPNRMQRRLGRFDTQLVQGWIQEHNAGLAGAEEYGEAMKPIQENPAKLLVSVSRWDYYQAYLTVQCSLIGADGSVLATQMGYLASEDEINEYIETEENEGQTRPARPGDDIPLKWSEDAQLLANSMPYSTELPKTIPARVLEVLRNPDEFEPLRYAVGEGLVEAARRMGKSLVAVPGDTSPTMWGGKLPETYGELRNSFQWYGLAEPEPESNEGWLLLPARDSLEQRKNRVDRVELANLLRSAEGKVFLPLDTVATFVHRNPQALNNPIVTTRLMLMAPSAFGSGFFAGATPEMLGLYGSLSTAQRQMVKNGQPLTYSQLSADSRAYIDKMVFGAVANLKKVDPQVDLQEPSVNRLFDFEGEESFGPWAIEPTEHLGNGIHPQSPFRSNRVTGTYAIPTDESGNLHTMSFPMGKEELAYFKLMLKQPEYAAEMTNYISMLEGMRLGQRDMYFIVIQLSQTHGLTGTLVDLKDPDPTKKYGLSSLPDAFRAEVDRLAEELSKTEYGQMLSGGFGGGGTIKP